MQRFELPFGEAHVFYPEASTQRCTAALAIDVDRVGLVRRRGRGSAAFALADYVNDRAYTASSFLSVALVSVFSAMSGACVPRTRAGRPAEEYCDPTQIDRLGGRGLGRKRSLALPEFGLGIEALERSCATSRSTASMRASSGCSPWRASRSTRACSPAADHAASGFFVGEEPRVRWRGARSDPAAISGPDLRVYPDDTRVSQRS